MNAVAGSKSAPAGPPEVSLSSSSTTAAISDSASDPPSNAIFED